MRFHRPSFGALSPIGLEKRKARYLLSDRIKISLMPCAHSQAGNSKRVLVSNGNTNQTVNFVNRRYHQAGWVRTGDFAATRGVAGGLASAQPAFNSDQWLKDLQG